MSAHPHVGNDNQVAVVRDGIIENFASLRLELEERGDRDAVGVPTPRGGVHPLVTVFADEPDRWWPRDGTHPWWSAAATGRTSSPATSPCSSPTRDAVELGQDQVVELRADSVTITDYGGHPAEGRTYHVNWDASAAEKGGHD